MFNIQTKFEVIKRSGGDLSKGTLWKRKFLILFLKSIYLFYFQNFTLQTVVDMKRVSWSQSAMLWNNDNNLHDRGNCYRDTHHRLAIQCSQANELYNLLGINLIQPSTLLPPCILLLKLRLDLTRIKYSCHWQKIMKIGRLRQFCSLGKNNIWI